MLMVDAECWCLRTFVFDGDCWHLMLNVGASCRVLVFNDSECGVC